MRVPVSAHDLVRRFYERLWNAWDDTAVDDTLAPDIAFRGSLGTSTTGRNQWRTYRDQIRCGAPDFHNEIIDLISDTHRAAARLRYSGTHLGTLLGIPATGRRFAYSGAAFFTTTDDLIADIWVLGDLDSLRQQLTEQDR
ncbi:ester cyclase [Mycobacterium simiae]|uniref:Ester cyclase n=1 Tax=Mycobacterium simiae TaxID=1784 RepID=A0A5B1B623_MYCSI|nr:ester cyclase [Mycobacterium simiae]KAA1243898.1 ester cyclase [Mycobacterium simiae]